MEYHFDMVHPLSLDYANVDLSQAEKLSCNPKHYAEDLLSHRLQGELQFARHQKSLYQLEFLVSWPWEPGGTTVMTRWF